MSDKTDNLKVAELQHEITKAIQTYNANNDIEERHVLKALHQTADNVIWRLFNNGRYES